MKHIINVIAYIVTVFKTETFIVLNYGVALSVFKTNVDC